MIEVTSMEIEDGLRNRIVGTVVVTILAMIFLPMLLNEPKEEGQEIASLELPQKPQDSMSLTGTILPDSPEDVTGQPSSEQQIKQNPQQPAANATTTVPKVSQQQQTDASATAQNPQSEIVKTANTQVKTPPKTETTPTISAATLENAKKLQPPRLDSPPANTSANASQGKRWFIQVASFSDQENANAFRDKLRRQGFPATVDSVWSKNKRIYRLRVGPELNRQRAETIKNKLNRLNNVKSIILSD